MTEKAEIVLSAVDRTKQAFDSAKGRLTSLGKEAGAVTSGLAGLGLAAAAAGALTALDRIANQVAGYQDLAEKIGDTAVNVSGLQRAADLSETSLDNVAAASARLTSTLSKNDDESKGVGKALAAINIPIKEFKELNPTAQLERVATSLGKFEDGAGKTAVAIGLFGKAGADLLPFLKDLNEVGTKNSKLTQQQIEDADKFTKALAGTKSEFAELARVVGVSVLPVLTEYAAKLKELLGGGKSQYTLATEISVLKSEIEKLQGLGPGFTMVGFFGTEEQRKTEIAKLEKELSDARKRFYALTLEPGAQSPAESRRFGMLLEGINFNAGGNRDKKAAKTPTGIDGPPLDRLEAIRVSELAQQAQVNQALATAQLNEAEQARAENLRRLTTQQSEFNALLDATPTAQLEKAREQLDLLADSLGKTTDPKQAQKIREAMDALAGSAGVLPQVTEAAKTTNDAAKELGLTFTSAFEDAIVGGKNLSSILKGLEQDLLRIAVRKAITEPLGNAVSGGIGKLGSGFDQLMKNYSAGTVGGFGGAIATLFSGFFADGGFVPPGRWGVAGERGPEPVFGGKTGLTVQPLMKAGSSSGRVTNNSITVHPPSGMSRESGQQLAADIARQLRIAEARNG